MKSAKMIQPLEAISSILCTTHHQEYQEKGTADTCNWLLEDQGFHEWESSRALPQGAAFGIGLGTCVCSSVVTGLGICTALGEEKENLEGWLE